MVYLAPRLFIQVDSRTDCLVNNNRLCSFHQIVDMGDNPLFNGAGDAVTGQQTKKRAFISTDPGTRMAFNNSGDRFR